MEKVMDCMAQFYKLEGQDMCMEKVCWKCGCCHIGVVPQSKGHPRGQLHLLWDSLDCEE